MSNRIIVQGASIEDIRARLLAQHGPGVKILSVEKVTQGGISGFMAKHFFEATAILPAHPGVHPDSGMDLSRRLGIAALLDGANNDEDALRAADTGTHLSTDSPDFDALMSDLSNRNIDAPIEAPAPRPPAPISAVSNLAPPAFTALRVAPKVVTRPGDLALVIGLGQDALAVAQSMAKALGSIQIHGGGLIKTRGVEALTDRRTALLARAESVGADKSIVCAYGLEPGAEISDVLEALNADQVWVVADAGRKIDDTRRWVNAVASHIGVHAVAVINTRYTETPETVNSLGLPIGWVDGAATASPRL